MGYLIKGLVLLIILGVAGLAGYAYLGDMAPGRAPVVAPVALDGQ